MALINTEEGAKRLARVILSDIELYSRERPQVGENLATQIDEGRRLFKSRVTGDVLALFDVVLTDRQQARARTPTPVAPAAAAAAFAPQPAPEDQPTPAPRIAAPASTNHPAPVSMAPPAVVGPTPGVRRKPPSTRVPVEPFPSMPSAGVESGPATAPFSLTASEAPVPILTSRISIPRLLALVALMGSAIALACRYLR